MVTAVHSPGTKDPVFGNEADQKWGYVFGSGGLLNAEETAKFLCISERQLDRLAVDGHIRKGRMPGSRYRFFCKRSVTEFAQGLEQ